MSWIDRYVHEVGRHLPREDRADIQEELRSLLVDTLEDRAGSNATEEDELTLLKEHGDPRKVAASYAPEGQYLIGPELFPTFQLVVWITLGAVVGAQLLAWWVAISAGQEPFSPWQALAGLVSAIPSALGTIVFVFFLLQRFGVRPELGDAEWDPRNLPTIDDVEPVKRGERIFGIIVQIAILVLLVFFPQWIGFVVFPGGVFFANPVIQQFGILIALSILVSLALDIYLLWQGRWKILTRFAKIAVNVLSIVVLMLLIQGHSAWLAENGASGLIDELLHMPSSGEASWQVIGMQGFRMAFGVAALVTIVDTGVMVLRLVRARLRKDGVALTIPLK